MPRSVLHVDCDCFYAAVEMRDDPDLRDVPLAVGGASDRRGVVATCNYAARAFGVRSAMPTARALRLCPDLVLRPADFPRYRAVSAEVQAILARHTDLVEPLSLDEAYLDVTDSAPEPETATRVARTIRAQVRDEVGITVSAGVADCKFLAKIASDWNKPDGLHVIAPAERDAFVAALPVECLPGVGPVTAARLRAEGLGTCADVRAAEPGRLLRDHGGLGRRLLELAHGRDDRSVRPTRSRKSVSVEETFAVDAGPETLRAALLRLIDRLDARHRRAREEPPTGRPGTDAPARPPKIRGAFVKLRFSDFTVTTAEVAAVRPDRDLFLRLLERAVARNPRPARLAGVGYRYGPPARGQLDLFDASPAGGVPAEGSRGHSQRAIDNGSPLQRDSRDGSAPSPSAEPPAASSR